MASPLRRLLDLSLTLAFASLACAGKVENGGLDAGIFDANGLEAAPPCDSDGWRRFDAQGLFAFRAPCTLVGGPEHGVDSQVGKYHDVGFEMTYDFGIYWTDFESWKSYSEYAEQSVVIDGRPATLRSAHNPAPTHGFPFLSALSVPSIYGGDIQVSMFGSVDMLERRVVLTKVLQSVDFP